MSDESTNQDSRAGIGCAIFVMGLISAAFGVAALLHLSDRIELEFFGIELNDRRGHIIWVAGSAVLAVVGWLLLRSRRGAR